MLIQLLVNGVVAGCAYALVALGFALIYGTTRTFHFAHGAVYTLSAYLFYTLYKVWGLPLVPMIVVTLGLAALFGILIDRLIYLPLVRRGSSQTIQLLSSLGFYLVTVNFIAMSYGSETKVLSSEVQSNVRLGSIVLSQIQWVTFFSFAAFFTLLLLALRKTSLGKIIRATRDDPALVSSLGINLSRVRGVVFAIGSALAALAAILRGIDIGVEPGMGMGVTMTGAVSVIIGGVGVFEAAAFGALLLGVLQSLAAWKFSLRWQDLVTFLVLLLFLLFRPQGIFSYRRRIEEVTV